MPDIYEELATQESEQRAVPQQDGPSIYDTLADEEAAQRDAQLSQSLGVALKEGPEVVAKRAALSKKTGIPLDVVTRNEQEIELRQRQEELRGRLAASPFLALQMSNPEFAGLAHDNVENLSGIEQAFQVLKNTGKAAVSGLRSASAGSIGIARAPLDFASIMAQPLVGTVLPANPFGIASEGLAEWQQGIAGRAKAEMPQGDGVLGSGYYSGIASLSRNLAALPMAFLPGGQEAALGAMVAPVFGEGYGQARDAGKAPGQSLVFGTSQAAIEYATEKLPLTKLLGDLKEGAPFLKTLLHNAALEVPGEQIATVLQDLNDWAVLNPDKPFADYIAERPNAAAQTLIATLVGTGGQVSVMEGVSKAVGYAEKQATKAQQAEQQAAFLENMNKLAAADKLLQRSPDDFQSFVAAAAEDGPVDTVFIDGKTLMQSGMAPQLAELSPAVRDQLDRAIVTGGQIAIPVDEYAARIAPTDLAPQLLDHLKTDAEGFSRAEAADFMTNQGAELQAEVERILTDRQDTDTFRASQDVVKQDILGQLNTAGRFTPQVNEAYATLASAYSAVRAAQLGMTPEAFHAERGMRVQGAAVAGQRYENATVNPLDSVREGSNANGKYYVVVTEGVGEHQVSHSALGVFARFKNEAGKNTDSVLNEDGDFVDPHEINRIGSGDSSTRAYIGDAKSRDVIARLMALSQDLNTSSEIASRAVDVIGQIVRGEITADDARALFGQTGNQLNQSVPIQTDTPAFKAWFGDSKVVEGRAKMDDAEPSVTAGSNNPAPRPLVVYHGTNEDFNSFDVSKQGSASDQGWFSSGFYFTPDKEFAESFGGKQVAAYLSIKNPYDWRKNEGRGLFQNDRTASLEKQRELIGRGYDGVFVYDEVVSLNSGDVLTEDQFNLLVESSPLLGMIGKAKVEELLRTREYDSSEFIKSYGEKAFAAMPKVRTLKEIVAFSPTQIKSAIGNSGRFDPADPNILNQSAYHGSPYKFDKFSLDHMGKGEGAQAYGWGLYFAGNKAIAEFYRQALASQEIHFNGKKVVTVRESIKPAQRKSLFTALKKDPEIAALLDESFNNYGDINSVLDMYVRYAGDFEKVKEFYSDVSDYFKPKYDRILSLLDGKLSVKTKGQLYEVEIPDEGEYLLWDKPLSEQPAKVQAALKQLGETNATFGDFYGRAVSRGWTGGVIYTGLAGAITDDGSANIDSYDARREGRSPQQASKALNKLGIAGIKYLDGTSRDKGDGSYNYVIFDENAVEILQTYYQPDGDTNRGAFSPATNTVTLLNNADLSTFLHEAAHYFFESDIKLASELLGKAELTAGEQQIVDDVSVLLKWHGIQGDVTEQLRQWHTMDFEEQRSHHERTAESFEAYLFSGKAPSLELQPVFQRFAAWMVNVYKSLKDFLTRNPEAGKLNDEVRQVFDRMIATREEIALAEQARSMMPLFNDPAKSGVSADGVAAIHAQHAEATATAVDELQAKGLRDLQWRANARGRQVAKLKKLSKALRAEVEIEARREVMSQPVYQAWGFLTRKMGQEDQLPALERKSDPDILDPTLDSLFVAIAKLGGIKKDQVLSEWGVDPKDIPQSGLFGKPVWRITDGMTLDGMASALAEHGYLPLNEHGQYELNDLGDRFLEELSGNTQYSHAHQPQDMQPGEQIANPAGLGAGRLDLSALAVMGEPDEVVNALKARKMTAAEGMHPDLVATLFDFSSGDEMVRKLASVPSPKEAITALADRMMLENHGELATPEAIERAADAAIHNDARARMLTTEYNALAKALGETEQVGTDKNGRPIMRRILESAAKEYAAAMIARLKVRDIKPGQYANAEVRAAKASAKALRVASESTEAEAVKSATESLNNAKQRLEAALSAEPVFNEDGEVDTTEIDKARRNIATQEGRLKSAEERYRIAQRGSLKVAAEEKRNQVINTYATRAAYDAQDEVKTGLDYIRRRVTSATSQKNMRGEARAQLLALLDRFDLRKSLSLAEIDRQQSLAEWAASEAERLAAPPPILSPEAADEGKRTHYKNLTVAEFRGLIDSIKQLEFLARREHKAYLAIREMSLQEEVAKSVAEIREAYPEAFDEDGKAKLDTPLTHRYAPSFAKNLKEGLRHMNAEFVPMEELIGQLTGGKFGLLHESLFGRISGASDRKSIMAGEIRDRLAPFYDAYTMQEKRDFSRKVVGDTGMTKENILMLALYYGNVEGRQRLASQGFNDQKVLHLLGFLDEKDLNLAEAIWSLNDDYIWPQYAALNERTQGKAPPKVQALPMQVNGRDLRGGYVKLVYDSEFDETTRHRDSMADAMAMIGGRANVSAKTNQGSSIERVQEISKMPLLELRAMSQAVNEHMHDIAYREAVADTVRVLREPAMRDAIKAVSGKEVYSELLAKVNEVAARPADPSSMVLKALNLARKNTIVVLMSGIKTALVNYSGMLPAMTRVNAGALAKNVAKVHSWRMREMVKFAMDRSEYMRERNQQFTSDLQHEMASLTVKNRLMPEMGTFLILMRMVDQVTSTSVWLAAYEEGVKKYADETQAVEYANSVTRGTQGAGRDVDTSKIMTRFGPWSKPFLMFYSFFNRQLGLLVRQGVIAERHWNKGQHAKAVGLFTASYLAIVVIPALINDMAGGKCDDAFDGEEGFGRCISKAIAMNMAGFVPVLRDVAPYAWAKLDDSEPDWGLRSTALSAYFEGVIKGAASTVDVVEGDADEKDTKAVFMGLAFSFGLPGKLMWDVTAGTESVINDDAPLQSVLFGPPKD